MILVFETFKENFEKIDVMSVSKDNANLILYSTESNVMTLVHRELTSYE